MSAEIRFLIWSPPANVQLPTRKRFGLTQGRFPKWRLINRVAADGARLSVGMGRNLTPELPQLLDGRASSG
jgi:hypothetical protein